MYSPHENIAFRRSDAALERVRTLLDKHEDGVLTSEESRELDRLVLLDDMIGRHGRPRAVADGANAESRTASDPSGR